MPNDRRLFWLLIIAGFLFISCGGAASQKSYISPYSEGVNRSYSDARPSAYRQQVGAPAAEQAEFAEAAGYDAQSVIWWRRPGR